jgi:tetratricopeptide (TPR) repeat protein
VVHNELGRVYFLEKRYTEAVKELQKTLAIDPEDLQANYNLMLCYTGLGDEKMAGVHKDRYLRFKADEAAQALTGAYRQAHPDDNNERQPIHEHVSVGLRPAKPRGQRAAGSNTAAEKNSSVRAGAGR